MKEHFSRFFDADPHRLHFAAHSHHPWPDVTFDAHMAAWETAALLVDFKWDYIFDRVVPRAQRGVANILGLPDPSTIAFAASTHTLLTRLVSALPTPTRILTTDAEFHSAARQFRRWEEASVASVDRVPAQPFATFPERFIAAAGDHDLIFLSQVHFDSGYVTPDINTLVAALPSDPVVVVDGYHGFMAVPTDLSAIADRIFYLAGGYKYAMAGEGACFLHAPPGWLPRPVDTGWFAGFDTMTEDQTGVPYPLHGGRFAGGTFDSTGVFRLGAVLEWVEGLELTVEGIHDHVRGLQDDLLEGLPESLTSTLLPERATQDRGNFLTFVLEDAGEIHRSMAAHGVVTDYRANRWRIGMGIYQDRSDIDRFVSVWETANP
ncbi:MAG: aminotransferase class V-fold PLP-dependent enzyme [Acidimicrobiia bacterium]|nr:aminotransferase class V-fold PLP-dependent enzyme [Acidimicrobiia bacterium]